MRCGRVVPLALLLATAAAASIGACGKSHLPETAENDASTDAPLDVVRIPYDGLAAPEAGPRTAVHADLVTSRVDTMWLMFAAGEMQTSGEPFAQNFAGRNLQDYNRYWIPVDQYLIPTYGGSRLWNAYTDLFGFSSAVESYEYSKYHMNLVANQTGAGVSLANGPLVAALPGASPFEKLRSRVERLLYAAGTNVAGYAFIDGGVPTPDPQGGSNPLNDFGFPGLWPNLMPYRSWDPTMQPDPSVTHSCTTQTGYGGVAFYGNNPVYTYECDYNTLNLPNRPAQVEPVIGPGVLGYTTWKEAIWGIDFTGRLHDSNSNPVTEVKPEDMSAVGTLGNRVLAIDPGAAQGTFIGSTPLEGMWGLLMVDEIDNAGSWLLSSLLTSDGATLGGFPSVEAGITYDYPSPLVWFPTAIAVTEDRSGPHSPIQIKYPAVNSVAIQDATSKAVDLAALVQGYSLFFGMTDTRNAAVGQQIGLQVAFDGGAFASDDGLPDGENSPHDRSLAVMRTAFVDLDRLHVDPSDAKHVVMDSATVSGGGAVTRSDTATTTTLGHVVVGLRHLLMGCNAAVSQYGAPDPDPSKDAQGILNSIQLNPPYGEATNFSRHVREVLMNQADFVVNTLSQPDGTVANGATFANGAWTPTTDATLLESQGAALRVLVEAWFLSQDTKYRDRGRAVATKLFTSFWSDPARMFRGVAGGADDVVMTPERFGWLQQALREIYEGIWVPGDTYLDRAALETTIARVNKLYLNGWDDLNGNQTVDKPGECLDARMQLGEQALTGEVATVSNGNDVTSGEDRENDCVLNIAFTGKAAVLGTVHFHAP